MRLPVLLALLLDTTLFVATTADAQTVHLRQLHTGLTEIDADVGDTLSIEVTVDLGDLHAPRFVTARVRRRSRSRQPCHLRRALHRPGERFHPRRRQRRPAVHGRARRRPHSNWLTSGNTDRPGRQQACCKALFRHLGRDQETTPLSLTCGSCLRL